MPLKNDYETAKVTQEIERYLQSHPNAGDTVEGVARWWLQRQRYIETLDNVRNALDVLVEKGSVEKRINADGQNVYRSRILERIRTNLIHHKEHR